MTGTNSLTDVTEQIRLAAEYDRKGDHAAAEEILRSIDRAVLEREYEESAQRVPKEIRPVRTINAASRAASNASVENQLAMFGRDRFICRYCGKKTIFVPTLRALSLLHPDAFPYHTNWD
ncbi:MAG: hypothetical protein ACR2JW_03700 [Thermomicrobiales bacterium]